ncbi:MAG: zinc-dependent metalloprotease [Nocardioidaceae bacterium]
MPDLPGRPDDDEPAEPSPQNPFAGTPFEQMFASLASGDMSGMQAMFGQLQRMFAPHEGAVNWDFVRDLARQVVAQHADRSPDSGDRARLQDVAQLAEHWLDGATDFPATTSAIAAWSRAEWVEASMPVWRRLVEPVAESVVGVMGKALPEQAQAMAGPMLGMLTQIGGAMFSQQIGQAVGGLSQEVVSATDVGIPMGEVGHPAIVLTNAFEFATGLAVDESDVLLHLVLRECAYQRLYAHAPWLREYLFSLIEEYGKGITINTSHIQEQLGSLDPSNMEGIQEALSGGLFDLEQTPRQQAALSRLETVLALLEGWVDEVVGQAADQAMPQAAALREAVRRRRATGGPAEATFTALVGLELRPRRLRDAAALWGALRAAEGPAARDAVWAHRDLLPTAADLDDPLAYAQRTKEADELDTESPEFDAALAALLDESKPSETGAADAEPSTDQPVGDAQPEVGSTDDESATDEADENRPTEPNTTADDERSDGSDGTDGPTGSTR